MHRVLVAPRLAHGRRCWSDRRSVRAAPLGGETHPRTAPVRSRLTITPALVTFSASAIENVSSTPVERLVRPVLSPHTVPLTLSRGPAPRAVAGLASGAATRSAQARLHVGRVAGSPRLLEPGAGLAVASQPHQAHAVPEPGLGRHSGGRAAPPDSAPASRPGALRAAGIPKRHQRLDVARLYRHGRGRC